MNYNYIFVFYDINEKRVNKIFKICKKYLNHHQKSVFRGQISPANIIKLKGELNKTINPKEDFISIIKLVSESYFAEEILGTNPNKSNSMFI
ncbi:MAG TPA: CRISPR-associated endonuclease Cas2 [Candidatus Atribacteria bacterium]|nr:CRISPR-associated endonuclease Cas2 [Candidatus Atribacteria bacterium]